MADDVLARCRVAGELDLDEHDPREAFGWEKQEAQSAFPDEIGAVAELQKRLFAESASALLVVLQGMDAAGKGGTIRSALTGINPAGVDVNNFGVPSDEEAAHDFLWRIHPHTPPKGMIGIFDRSHYEDVLVVRVKRLAPEPVWRRRFEHIRNFERLLVDEGTHVVKLFLNVSNEEQRARLQDRVDSPDERWKFRAGDLDDRELWGDFRSAYQEALVETSVADAPWYVVPADRKWVRNRVVARILRHHLERIDPQYPPAAEGIEGTIVA